MHQAKQRFEPNLIWKHYKRRIFYLRKSVISCDLLSLLNIQFIPVNLVRYFPDDKVYNIFVEKGKPLLMFERGDAVYPQAIPESYRQKLLIE